MKVLFAVNNDEISNAIIKKYQKEYKEIISYKNVYYFNAIIKELQRDSSYDRIVISEELEPFANNNYDTIDKFIFEKLDNISDEATNKNGNDTDIILICSDRRTKSDEILNKLFGIGVYNAIIGSERNITEICKLINSPRNKKDAKLYYKIDLGNVMYQAENENNVSEAEVQNILAHYKKLGKNEEKYVESFNNIVTQYNDTQLKIIIRYLPMGVKAVLEEKSPKYQQLMTFGNNKSRQSQNKQSNIESNKNNSKQNINVTMIEKESKKKSMKKPVVIPAGMNLTATKKIVPEDNDDIFDDDFIDIIDEEDQNIETSMPEEKEEINIPDVEELFEDNDIVDEINETPKDDIEDIFEEDNEKQIQDAEQEQPKRGRGRPRKKPIEEVDINKPKRGRGRPKKNIEVEEKTVEEENNTIEDDDDFDLFALDTSEVEETKPLSSSKLDEEDNDDDIDLFSLDDEFDESDEETTQELEEENEEDNDAVDLFSLEDDEDDQNDVDLFGLEDLEDEEEDDQMVPVQNTTGGNATKNNLISKDKKVVAFVGTTKNGTSFVVNNLAEILSAMGISTAILDMSKNKNAYYIYTNNNENLRQVAANSIYKLKANTVDGIKVNKNLSIFTDVPGEEKEYTSNEIDTIINTLSSNYSVVLIDCDFSTAARYFERSQEIYLVQSMDVLTIQPLTAFLKQLKNRGVLQPDKLRVIVNKEQKMKNLPIKLLIAGISKYNSPDMTLMDDLFNKDTIKYCTIPFEMQNYSKYLETLVDCNISLNGYSKQLMSSLRNLAAMVYPLIGGNNYQPRTAGYNNFSLDVNSTLNKMKKNYQ